MDMHLTPDEFTDVAEGTRTDASLPHLATCGECRDQLTAMRAAMSDAADADVPEPSPLFWEHLSERVSEAVDRERAADRRWWNVWARPRVLLPLSAVAVCAILGAVMLSPRATLPGSPTTTASRQPQAPVPANVEPASEVFDLAADPLLTLVADLSANMDWDTAADAGFVARGSAEHAVTHMNTEELRALQRVLREELARSGA